MSPSTDFRTTRCLRRWRSTRRRKARPSCRFVRFWKRRSPISRTRTSGSFSRTWGCRNRAWTVPVGATAPQAAGVIHTDFERGFIRAEVIAFEDYVAGRGEQGAREAGKMRLEGRDYVVRDGDVMHFRFNV